MWSLLKERNFRLLWLGQLSSQFGDRLTQLVLVALAAARTSGSALTLAKVLVFTSLPALLLNPFAGAFVDRWDRKRTMIACDLLRVAAILSLPWLAKSPTALPLYAGVFLLFAVSSFFVPARLALIPDLVPADRLAQANALFTTSGMIGSTLILLAGALIVEWAGPMRSALLNAVTYAASAAAIAPIVRKVRTVRGRESTRTILHEIWEGLRGLWLHPDTRRVVALLGILMAGSGASIVAGTVLVQRSLGTVTKDLGFLSLWLGLGMLGGTLAHTRWGVGAGKRRVLGLAFLGCGVALWLFVGAVAGWRSGVAASLTAGLMGLFIAPVGIVANTLVHEAHPERLHGRIFSSLGVVVNLSLILSMLAAGWLAERWGEPWLLAGVGLAFAGGGAALIYSRRGSHS